jgi:FkbM family methyltransferase
MSFVPKELKVTLSKQSWVGSLVHRMYNTLPVKHFPVLPCSGVLESYRMRIDWRTHRSYIYGTWEPEITQIIVDTVSPGMIVLDIGGHIGFYTLLMSRLVGETGKVYSFEPFPRNLQLLQENIELNKIQNVQVIPSAVSDMTGMVSLLIDGDHDLPGRSSLVYRSGKSESSMEVETTSIDDVMANIEHSIDFMKIDVEGAEDLVLKGALKTIQKHHPIILVELHQMGQYDDDHPALYFLQSLSYQTRWLDKNALTAHVLAFPSA